MTAGAASLLLPRKRGAGGIYHYSEFSGCGGTSDGADQVPGVETIAAANHDKHAIASHEMNFPYARHFQEDLTKLPIDKMPWCHLFTASPACPAWTTANGMKRTFDKANAEEQPTLFDDEEFEQLTDKQRRKRASDSKREQEYKRSRLLMKEVPRYLRAQVEKGRPVPIGFVENVVQCRLWHEWDDWIAELRKMRYEVVVLAVNSMHVRPVRAAGAPQSRNRLYVAFWHRSLGRTPDWQKWLGVKAFCSRCVEVVDAVKTFKDPTKDMGTYGAQYIFTCPKRRCGGHEVVPDVAPAISIIDPTLPGSPIGGRARGPLELATLLRVARGIKDFWLPLLTPVGGTWRAGESGRGAVPLDRPFPAQTTRETDAVAVPPMVVPTEGRPGKRATSGQVPIRTMTTRRETGIAFAPFITPLRGGGDRFRARRVADPLTTVTASGNHHGLASAPAQSVEELGEWASRLLVPYYGPGAFTPEYLPPAADPGQLAHLSDMDFASWEQEMAEDAKMAARIRLTSILGDVLFRMLDVHEVQAAMAFRPDYRLSPRAKRDRVRLLGNAVTPNVAEAITSALVECLTGESLERELVSA